MLAFLLACSSVYIDDAGMFPVLSAFSYTAWDVEGIGPSGRDASATDLSVDHSVALTDATLGCVRAQGYQAAWNDWSAKLLAASDDGNDADAMAAGMPDFLARMDAAYTIYYPPQMQRLSFGFCVDGSDEAYCGGDVEPGEYVLNEMADMGGGQGYAYGRYWRDREEENAVDGTDLYEIEGTITITGGDGQVLAGSWEGTLVGSEEGLELDGADTSGSFSTIRCEVEHTDTLVVSWL